MSCELGVVRGRPCDLSRCAESTNPSMSCVPPRSRRSSMRGGRCAGSDWMFIATSVRSRSLEDGSVRSAGRIATRVDALDVFAQSLVAGDVVALEATTGSDKIVSILERHGVRVVVANTRKLKSITDARAKTDRLDAKALARLLMSGLLDAVWTPDERTRTLRRLTSRRERIVRARTRAKNESHGVLVTQPVRAAAGDRRVRQGRPRVAGGAGVAGRRAPDARRLLAADRLPRAARSRRSTARSRGSRSGGRRSCG